MRRYGSLININPSDDVVLAATDGDKKVFQGEKLW